MALSDKTYNEKTALVMELSPRAKSIIETEMYKINSVEETITPSTILQEAFLACLEDLEEIGVLFTCPNEDIYNDSEILMTDVFGVLEWILPSKLYPKLRRYPLLVQGIETLLQGVSDDPLLEDYLVYLGGHDQRLGFTPNLKFSTLWVKNNTRCTSMFGDYLEGMIDRIKTEKTISVSVMTDVNEWNRFREKLESRIASAFLALGQSGTVTDEDFVKMRKRIDIQLTRRLQCPDTSGTLRYLYLTDPTTRPHDGQMFYAKCLKEYHVSSKFFPEYFTTRELPIKGLDLLGFVLYAYGISDTNDAFQSAVAEMAETYVNHKPILTQWAKTLLSMGD